MRRFLKSVLFALSLSYPAAAFAAPVVFESTGVDPVELLPAIDDFRAALGDLNTTQPGPFADGRREINWDGAPDTRAAPNLMPPDLFKARGVVFFTPGSGFQLSADDDNPTGTPPDFGNIRSFLQGRFRTFSPQRLFTALDSNVTEVLFVQPGTSIPATTDGFGVVFTDVNRADSTKIEYLDQNGNLIFSHGVQPGPERRESLSFLGVSFDAGEKVYMVRITSGSQPLDRGPDQVAMDDFIYGEPQPVVP